MSTLPQRLELTETGEHVMPAIYSSMSTMNVDHDQQEWVPDGWQARTYEGVAWFKHKEKSEVQAWLGTYGYKDTCDGAHYERAADAPLDAFVEPWPLRSGVYSVDSTYTKESGLYTALGLLEIADYVNSHKEQLEQEAIARREELGNE